MYIRQMCLISFEEIIKFQQETKLEMILSQIDVSKLANSLRKSSNSKGPKGYEPTALIYALIAMQIVSKANFNDIRSWLFTTLIPIISIINNKSFNIVFA